MVRRTMPFLLTKIQVFFTDFASCVSHKKAKGPDYDRKLPNLIVEKENCFCYNECNKFKGVIIWSCSYLQK